MNTIDERVVEMRFDNKQFESAANESLTTLEKLGRVLDNTASADNVKQIAESIDGINFGSAVSGVESLADRFSTLGIVAKRVLENITDTLMGKLAGAINSVTGSIVSGGIKRAMNIENAHFQLQGLISDETEVQAIMKDAMDSVDGTAYAYDSAAKAASMFAATGLSSGKEMQNALRAIAGVAATTNSDYDSLAQIFTTVAGQGRVMADQLNQLAVRGMNAAAALTKYFNGVNDGSIEATESVKKAIKTATSGAKITEADLRELVRKSKVSFEMFSEGMATTFGDHAKDANQTFTGAMANIRAALARTGAMFVSPLITQNGKAVELFNAIRIKINEVNKVLGPLAKDVTDFITRLIEGLTKVVKNLDIDPSWSWKLQRGFFVVIQAGRGLMDILRPIKEAFNETFGTNIGDAISDLGHKIFEMSFDFRASETTITNIKDGFKGFFDVLNLIIDGFMRLIGAISPASDAVNDFNGSVSDLFGDIGRGLSAFVKWVRESEAFNNVFEIINKVITKTTSIIKDFVNLLSDKAESGFANFGEKFKGLSSILETFESGGLQVLKGIWKMITPLIDTIKKFGEEIWKVLTAIDPLQAFIAFVNGQFMLGITNSFGKIAETITHVLLDTILISISNFILQLQELFAATTNFEYLVKALKSLSQALLVLAAACFVLSAIDDDKLRKGITAMTTFLVELMGAMLILSKFSSTRRLFGFDLKKKDFAIFYDLTDQIVKLALAVGILAASCKIVGSMPLEDLAKGLIAVTVLLGELVAVGFIMQHTGTDKNMTKVATTLIMMSASLLILTKAVKELGSMDLTSLSKGVAAIGAIMLEMSLFTKLVDGKKTSKAGFALIEMAAAIRILIISIKELASMSLEELSKGLVSLGIAIAEMVTAINLMPSKKSTSKAFAMIEFAAAMVIIAKSLQMLANESPNGLLNAVIAMGAIIFEMVVVLQLMPDSKNIGKAFAVIEMAVALVLISKALVPLAEADTEGLILAVISMGILLFEIVGVLAIMQAVKWANLDALAIIEMAVALVLISKALVPLTEVDQGDLLEAVLSMSIILAALTGVLAILSAIGPIALIGGVVAIALGVTANLLALALVTTAGALKLIKDLKLSEAEKDMDAFLLFLTKLSLVMALAGTLSPLINAFTLTIGLIAGTLALAGMALASSMMKFTPALTQLGDAIEKLNGIKCDNFLKNAEPVAAAIVKLGVAIKAFGPLSKVGSAAFVEVAEGINKLSDPLMKFNNIADTNKLANTFKLVADGIKEFGSSLKGFGLLSGIGASSFNEVADAIQKLAPALLLLSEIPGAKINSTMIALASGFEEFGKALDEYDIFDVWDAQAITLFADSVKTLAEPLVILSDVPGAKINSVMIALGSGFENFARSLQATPFWGVQGRSEALLNLCDGVERLAKSMPKLNEIDSETLLSKMTTIGNGFKKFGEALANAPLFNSSGRAEGITSLCDSIHNLADGILYFMDTTKDYKDDIEVTLGAIGNSFKVFGEALDSAPLIGADTRGEGIATLVNNIITLADGIADFSSRNFDDFSLVTYKISGAFKSFGEALTSAPLIGADTRGEGIATLIDSLSKLAEGIQKFTEVADADNFNLVMIKIKDAFLGFAEALDNTPWMFVEDRAGGIGAVVANVKTLAEGVGAFKDLDFNYITLLNQLGATLGDFGKAIDETPFWDNEGRAEAIIKVINALSPLADSAAKLAGQEGANAALQGFSSSISGLGSAMSNNWNDVDIDMINALSSVINLLGNIASLNITNLDAVNTSVSQTISWLKDLSNINIAGNVIDTVTNLATQFINSIKNLSPTLVIIGSSFVDSWLSGINQRFPNVSSMSMNMGNEFIKPLVTLSPRIYATSIILIDEFLNGIRSKYLDAENAGKDFGNKIVEALENLRTSFSSVSDILCNEVINGIENGKDLAYTAGFNLGNSVITALNDLYSQFVNVGKHVVEGFVEGINNNRSIAINAGTSLGQAAYNAAKDALAVQSPSKKFKYLGNMSGQGFIKGLHDQIAAVNKAGYSLGESSFDGLKSAVDLIYDYIDQAIEIDPTITPNVDMSNIEKAKDKTSELFNRAIAISTKNISGIPDQFTNYSYNQNEQLGRSIMNNTKDNSDLLKAIGSINDDIGDLKEAITNINMVLDTGALVGAITPVMDKRLGVRKMYAERGM